MTRTIGSFNVDEVTSTPLRLEKTVQLNGAQPDVFDFLTDHVGWSSWFPILSNVEMDNSQATVAGGDGAVCTCTMHNGASFSENIYGYDAPNHFAYAIEAGNPFGVEGHLAVVEVKPTGDSSSEVIWRQYFDHPDPEAMTQNVDEMLSGGLQALQDNFA